VPTINKTLGYRRGTARRTKSAEIVSAAAQLYKKSDHRQIDFYDSVGIVKRSAKLPVR